VSRSGRRDPRKGAESAKGARRSRGEAPSRGMDPRAAEPTAAWHRERADQRPETRPGSLAVAMAARRFLAHLDATPAVPVPSALRARIAASWPLHRLGPKPTKGC
jgi:hypothetical protein